MKIVDADHTNWRVKDLWLSLGFYRDVLGLELLGVDEYLRGERSLVSLRVTPTFILHLRPDPDFEPVPTGGYDHLALVVEGEGPDELAERLAASGSNAGRREPWALGARDKPSTHGTPTATCWSSNSTVPSPIILAPNESHEGQSARDD